MDSNLELLFKKVEKELNLKDKDIRDYELLVDRVNGYLEQIKEKELCLDEYRNVENVTIPKVHLEDLYKLIGFIEDELRGKGTIRF